MPPTTTTKAVVGELAPSITLPNYTGETFTFVPGANGRPVVLFFYPQSGSYGCTREACQFRDAIAEKDNFKPGRVDIIGISPDPVEMQKAFVEKQKLTYPVLSDTKREAITAYGVGKGMMGLVGTARVTYVIDKKGIVRDSLNATMDYGAHSKFVEKWLDKLEKEDAAAAPPTATVTAELPAPVPT